MSSLAEMNMFHLAALREALPVSPYMEDSNISSSSNGSCTSVGGNIQSGATGVSLNTNSGIGNSFYQGSSIGMSSIATTAHGEELIRTNANEALLTAALQLGQANMGMQIGSGGELDEQELLKTLNKLAFCASSSSHCGVNDTVTGVNLSSLNIGCSSIPCWGICGSGAAGVISAAGNVGPQYPFSHKFALPTAGSNGNWKCESCGNINYARRTKCNRCGLTKCYSGASNFLGIHGVQSNPLLPTSSYCYPSSSGGVISNIELVGSRGVAPGSASTISSVSSWTHGKANGNMSSLECVDSRGGFINNAISGEQQVVESNITSPQDILMNSFLGAAGDVLVTPDCSGDPGTHGLSLLPSFVTQHSSAPASSNPSCLKFDCLLPVDNDYLLVESGSDMPYGTCRKSPLICNRSVDSNILIPPHSNLFHGGSHKLIGDNSLTGGSQYYKGHSSYGPCQHQHGQQQHHGNSKDKNQIHSTGVEGGIGDGSSICLSSTNMANQILSNLPLLSCSSSPIPTPTASTTVITPHTTNGVISSATISSPATVDGLLPPSFSPLQIMLLKAKDVTDKLIVDFESLNDSDPNGKAIEVLKTALAMLGHLCDTKLALDDNPLQGIGGPHFSAPTMLAHPDEFKNPSSFLKIYGDPLCGTGVGVPVTNPVKGQNGNWVCSKCSNINFPRRFRCNKCNEYRDAEGDEIVSNYAKTVYYQHLKTYRSLASKQGIDIPLKRFSGCNGSNSGGITNKSTKAIVSGNCDESAGGSNSSGHTKGNQTTNSIETPHMFGGYQPSGNL